MGHLYGFGRRNRESVGRPREIEMRGEEGRGRREEEFIAVEIPIVEPLSSFLSKKQRERRR